MRLSNDEKRHSRFQKTEYGLNRNEAVRVGETIGGIEGIEGRGIGSRRGMAMDIVIVHRVGFSTFTYKVATLPHTRDDSSQISGSVLLAPNASYKGSLFLPRIFYSGNLRGV